MKKYILTILLISLKNLLFAQWTTPVNGITTTTNSVGIGTSEVQTVLDVQLNQSKTRVGLGAVFQLKTNESLANNPFKLSYYFSGASVLANRAFILQTSDHNIANGGNISLQALGGNVGIGTANPSSKLQIGDFATNNNNQIVIPGVYNFEQVRLGQISNGNAELEFVNHTGYDDSYGVRLLADLDQGAPGLSFQYAPSSSSYSSLQYSTGMHMNLNGSVSIGTTRHPAGYNFAVAGNMITEGITVKVQSQWPDYVFDSRYKLRNLSEIKTFIDQNHHLPEMPSAEQVQSNGVNLGELVKVQTKKIEELTLYLIKQESRIRKLETRLKSKDHK